jgi:hypothetical protein
MSRKLLVALTVVSMSVVMFLAGCGTEIAMKFNGGDVSTYKAGFQTKQFLELDMAKKTDAQDGGSSKSVEIVFTQEILSVNEDLSALAKITILDLTIKTKNNKGAEYGFDSRKKTDSKRALNTFVGKSYTMTISTDGKITPVDITGLSGIRISGRERMFASELFSEKGIIKRHSIPLPAQGASSISRGRGWNEIVWSHPKIMAVKAFEKSYVLDSISGDGIANISMEAYETDKMAEGDAPTAGPFALFAKAFDSQEQYTGEMQINLESGKVIKWSETCNASYVVTEDDISRGFNKNVKKDDKTKPASLTMGLKHTINFEKID